MALSVHDKSISATLNGVGQVLALDVSDAASAVIEMATTALSGHSVVFEVSNDAGEGPIKGAWDGATGTWRQIMAQRSNAASTFEATATSLAATPVYAWNVSVGGWRFLRVRVTAHTSGSANWTLTATDAVSAFAPPIPPSSVAINAGSALIGDMAGGTRTTAGGLATVARLVSSAATTNATVAKSSAGRVYALRAYNTTTSIIYLKLYNKATTPTVGTDVPVVTLALKPQDQFALDFGLIGQSFASGISYSITANPADNDNTAIAAGAVVGLNIWYA